MSGISGGISLEEYKKIKEISEVDIAAPISMIGYTGYEVLFDEVSVKDPGIYRLTKTTTDYDGNSSNKTTMEIYFSRGKYTNPDINTTEKYGIINFENRLSSYTRVLLAAIDPEEEARLVGLDKAVLPVEGHSYFSESDIIRSSSMNELGFKGISARETIFPILLSYHSFLNQKTDFKIEKLDIPFSNKEDIESSLSLIQKNEGEKYLKKVSSVDTKTFSYNSEESHKLLIASLSGIDIETGKKISNQNTVGFKSILQEKTGPLSYQLIDSPFPERWEKAYQVVPFEEETYHDDRDTYRKPQLTDPSLANNPRLNANFIGFYDPTKLNISKDPETELPMETYKIPTATLVLNKDDQPVNPPKVIKPTSNIYGYLMSPPTMLTTIEASEHILGNNPISAIRIKVKGVDELGDASQEKLEKVANEIESLTGHETTITLGSSPDPLLINIPKVGKHDSIGWIEQPWIKIGASIGIFKETKLGYSGIIACIILVSIIYVFSTNLVSFLSRKQEFAVLLAVGWKPKQLKNILMVESLLLGLIVSFVTLLIQIALNIIRENSLLISETLLLTFFVLLIYIIGPLGPARLINKIHPSQVMRTGEVSVSGKRMLKTKGLLSMVLNTVLGRLQRNLVSIIAIALPTTMLILFIYVTFRLNGVLYTSWLGQYVSMEVGAPHYIAVIISLIISILTTSEIMWQNIKERKNEIALLKAFGWKNKYIRLMVLIEGAIIGFLGGVVGGVISLGVIYFMYGPIPMKELWLPILTCLSPILVGIAGGWIPSGMAMKMEPIEGAKGIVSVKSNSSIDI
ncbi:FtsX-like permease family protein [Cytobacillus sp.]|uniref:FtsX-like permease family protein n=1 Tax=Cytobacillus sp. TaxID=2675269 RepID=UPI0028BD6A23|nr:FtsX-like permease family protein [Cytobacillus sp.]